MSRILIVDDMAASRETMAKLLQREGYQTDTAHNGAEGLVRLKQNKPDLILLDQMMPEVDGLTFLAGIRRFPKWKDLPVIMLTGNKDRSCYTKAQTLGVKECLSKGEYTVPALLEYVQKHLLRSADDISQHFLAILRYFGTFACRKPLRRILRGGYSVGLLRRVDACLRLPPFFSSLFGSHACSRARPETMLEPVSDIKIAPPAFPDAAAFDEVLYDYLRRADRMGWSPYDLVAQDRIETLARPERLTEIQVGAVKTVLFVEDHLPGYMSEYLRIMTDPDMPDDQQIINRQVLHFTCRWVGEEDRHAHVLEMYLTKTGLMKKQDLLNDMLRERKSAYNFPYDHNKQLIEGFIYLALQEKATHLYYQALARDINEPLLKSILTRMGADEASHGAFFYNLLITSCKGDLDALSRKISAVAQDFKMPVQMNLLNYRRQLMGMMRAAPSYKHTDVFANMMNAVDKAAKQYSSDSLDLISPDMQPFT